jgi:anti-sigma factor RsiW
MGKTPSRSSVATRQAAARFGAGVATALALLSIWLNPRALGPVRDDRAWIARGVFGERFWSNRNRAPVSDGIGSYRICLTSRL